MTEPLSTTASITSSVAAAAAAAPIVFNALPWLGDHGIVLGAAIAVGIVKTGMRETDTWLQTLKLFLSIVAVALFMTGTFAYLLDKVWHLPSPVLLSITSFSLGLAHGEWGNIFNKVLDWAVTMLPAKKGGAP
jgi:hypothetical protein